MILAYNCGNVLENTYRRIPKESVDRIILCDDGSTDNTVQEAQRLGIEYYTHKNLGYGGNIKFSIRKSLELGAEYIVDLHGDGQYDPGAIPLALAKARAGCDMVLGSRFLVDKFQPLKDEMSLLRYIANIGLSTVERFVLRSDITEFHTGFRVYTRRLAESVALDATSNNFLFGFEIIAQAIYAKLKIGEIPIRCSYKEEHTSISIPQSIVYAFQTFKVLALYVAARIGFVSSLFARQGQPTGIRAMIRRGVTHNAQVIKFLIAGGTAFVLHISILYTLTDIFGIYYILSNFCAFLFAFCVSFMLQKFWTFRNGSLEYLHLQIPLYLGMQVANIALNTMLLYIFVEYFHVWYLLAQIVITIVLAVGIFFINKRYIFQHRESAL